MLVLSLYCIEIPTIVYIMLPYLLLLILLFLQLHQSLLHHLLDSRCSVVQLWYHHAHAYMYNIIIFGVGGGEWGIVGWVGGPGGVSCCLQMIKYVFTCSKKKFVFGPNLGANFCLRLFMISVLPSPVCSTCLNRD